MKTACLILFMMASGAFARIGETEQQIVERYGSTYVKTNTGWLGNRRLFFRTEDYVVLVDIEKGKSVAENVSPKDKDGTMTKVQAEDSRDRISGAKWDDKWEPFTILHGYWIWKDIVYNFNGERVEVLKKDFLMRLLEFFRVKQLLPSKDF